MKVKTITLSAISVNIVHATNYPERRYNQWSTLSSSERGDASTLGYNSNTWNTPGTAAFESSASYDTVSSNAQNAAATFGLNDEETWDRWINHYENYDWEEMWEYTQSYWQTLGWTQNLWDNGGSVESDDKDWIELSISEKTAAIGVGFTQKLWDGVSLPFCVDSSEPFKFQGEKTCDWLEEDLSRCDLGSKRKHSSHCPNICGICDSWGCRNSRRKFLFNIQPDGTKVWKRCGFVGKKKETRCFKNDAAKTCRGICKQIEATRLDGC